MEDIVGLRQECNKTFDLGNRVIQKLASVAPIHYKDNYADSMEHWKDIDLTWEGNRIIKAPYELTLDGQKVTFKNKRTGEVSTLELLNSFPPGLKWEVIPQNDRVRFRHILPSDKVPFEAQFRVTGNALLKTKAFDDKDELELETTLVNGILTERLSGVVDKVTKKPRLAVGSIIVDPTFMVAASANDCRRVSSAAYFATDSVLFIAGYNDTGITDEGSAARFTSVNVPAGATITAGTLILKSSYARANTTVNTRLRAELSQAPTVFTDATDFDARTWTSAGTHVHWNNIAGWDVDEEGADTTSPSIVAPVQEVANLGALTNIVVLWDDFEMLSTQSATRCRIAHSYDASSTEAPQLSITYTTPVKGNPIPRLIAMGQIK